MSNDNNAQCIATPTRDEVREMVEEHWRQFLRFAAEGSKDLGTLVLERFEEKNQARASKMAPGQGDVFLTMLAEERDKIFDEYAASPESLKKRLGVYAPEAMRQPRSRDRQGMGEMVVKTAVRASIWALIWDLFR